MNIENKFIETHPMDVLQSLESAIASLPGEEKIFEHCIKLSSSAKLICQNNVKIQPYTTYDGPIFLAENAFVGPYCFLRGPLYIGPNVKIGPYSEIKNSVLMEGTTITHRNIIPDCVLQKNVWLAGGVMITNLRLDKRPVKFTWNGVTKTAEKFGLFAEENSTLGVGVTVMPATYLKKDARIFGPTTIKGVVG